MAGGKKIRKFLVRFVGAVIAVALLALLAVSLIIARPQDPEQASEPDKPSMQSSPALSAESEQDLYRLYESFPAPVMSFLSGSGMTFVSATSADEAFGGGFARVATLNWQTAEGQPVRLRTIWPANALSLLEDGFHFMPAAGPALFGSNSVRMENDEAVRLHTATDKALYTVLLPRALSADTASVCRSLQLFTVSD